MRTRTHVLLRSTVLCAVLLAVGTAATAQPPGTSPGDLVTRAGGVATSFADDGVPVFVWATSTITAAPGIGPEAAARAHLARFGAAFRVSAADLAAARVLGVQSLASGSVVAQFRQQVNGLDVTGSDVRVLMRGNQLVAIAGRPLAVTGTEGAFTVPAEQALAGALSDNLGIDVPASNLVDVSADPTAATRRFDLQTLNVRLSDPASVQAVFYPVNGRLMAAYLVQFDANVAGSPEPSAYRYIVAAESGAVLDRRNLTASEQAGPSGGPPPTFSYRVFANPQDGRPEDGPQADVTPHPTGLPDNTEPPFVPPIDITTGGINHQPTPNADPWLPADAVTTNGNNVDAYADHRAPDGLNGTDFRADLSAPATFGWTYDTALGPVATTEQSKAAITNAFYTVNWLHNYWYDAGFTEAAGNAQHDNYGRGGVGGDSMKVEVQDNYVGGSRNNANMSTPSDGNRPRMQLYAFTGEQQRSLTLSPGGTVATGTAAFGPTNFNVTAQVILANDGAGPSATDACEPLVGPYIGLIVLVDRGNCTFVVKAQRVQAAGAVGMIVANNAAGVPPPGLGGADPSITIAILSITLEAGNALKTALTAGPVTATMFRVTGTELDSALDNHIIAHEWGHYLHHRLADCGSQQCSAISEGWGDFLALHTVARAGDNLDGVYAAAPYATRGIVGDSSYFGIRRVPYSVDFTKNALTFRHISDGVALPAVPTAPNGGPNSEVHNAGEIWSSMMWEAYVALQKAATPGQTFDDVRRRMAEYVVTGLQMTPANATFTEQRDALFAAAVAARPDTDAGNPDGQGAGGADLLVLANAFARRGAGTCAIAPPRNSTNLVGVTESFDVRPRIALGEIHLDANLRGCDGDAYLDAGETGQLIVTVINAGPLEMRNTTVTVDTSSAGISLPRGGRVTIARLAAFTSVQVAVQVAVAGSVAGIGRMDLDVVVANAEACETSLTRSLAYRINADDAPGASATDTVETLATTWTTSGPDAWSRVETAPLEHAWFGSDVNTTSAAALESPALQVSASAPFVVSLDHRFAFESDGPGGTHWDGGVIEISRNGGPWADISAYASPGYGGTLTSTSGNPLGGRQALVGNNASWPARDTLVLNLGTAVAGETVRIRFVVATDAAVSVFGWEIDNINVQGITNLPFPALVPNQSVCQTR